MTEKINFPTSDFRELADEGFGPGMAHRTLDVIDALQAEVQRPVHEEVNMMAELGLL